MTYTPSPVPGATWFEITVGKIGVLTDAPSSEIPPNALIKAVNVDFNDGYIEKAPGSITYNLTAFTGGIVGLIDYWLDGVTQRMLVATADGKIWKDYGSRDFNHNTPITTGLGTLDNQCAFVIGGAESAGNPKKVFFFAAGKKQIQVISGDSNSSGAIALPATDWPNPGVLNNPSSYFPKFGLIHRSGLWVFMKANYYRSSTTNHEDFQTSNAILTGNIGPGEGGDIIGGFIYKGAMLVFKQGDYVYQLIDTDTDDKNWYFTKIAEGFSIANWHSQCQVLDDLLVMSSTGTLTSFQATLNYGNFTSGDMYKKMLVSKYFLESTTPYAIQFTQSIFYPQKGKGMWTTRSGYKTYNDNFVIYDVSSPDSPKFMTYSHYQADAISLRRDLNNVLRPMFGGTNGFVYLGDRETRSVGGVSGIAVGTPYLAEFKTPHMDFRQLQPDYAEKQKQYEHLGVTFTPDGNHNLSVDVWIDGKFSQTVTVTQTIDSNYLGAFKLGTSILGSEDEQTRIVPIQGTGRRISLRCYNGNVLESFKVSKLGIGFRILGEDQTRINTP